MNDYELYTGREQTLVKHFVLEHYLERFAHIVGSAWDAITYVDCFAGPWNARSESLEDSSFFLALQRLRAARKNLADKRSASGHAPLELRCFFLEKDKAAFAKLSEFAKSIRDTEIVTQQATLEESVDDIVKFVNRRRNDAFPFVFVDPTGWSGFALDLIDPLLKFRPGEVLFNFMTKDIQRFVESPDAAIRQSFDRLFGPIDYRARISGLTGLDREDQLVRCYCDAIRGAGGFDYVCQAIVLHPQYDRTHFHLLYATRNARGVEVFKKVEKKAMEVMEMARGVAQSRARQRRTGQLVFFKPEDMHDSRHYDELRERHLRGARSAVEQLLRTKVNIPYEDAWSTASSHPLVWESDLKAWIAEWRGASRVEISGMKPNQRTPSRQAGHRLHWRT